MACSILYNKMDKNMDEVDKMRSSQLANTASPEIQERFKRAKKLLLKLNAMSGYEEECRSVLEELIPGIPASATICPPFLLRSW